MVWLHMFAISPVLFVPRVVFSRRHCYLSIYDAHALLFLYLSRDVRCCNVTPPEHDASRRVVVVVSLANHPTRLPLSMRNGVRDT